MLLTFDVLTAEQTATTNLDVKALIRLIGTTKVVLHVSKLILHVNKLISHVNRMIVRVNRNILNYLLTRTPTLLLRLAVQRVT